MLDPHCFNLLFEIQDNDLDARLEMPEDFLNKDPKYQVNIIHGLREQFRNMDLGELKLTSNYDTEAHKQLLITQFGKLFPLTSEISIECTDASNEYSISLSHDRNMASIPQNLQPIFVALVIAALTSAGTLIVAANESLIS